MDSRSKTPKVVFTGYTTEEWSAVWTFFNTLNLAFVLQKTKTEAMARYDTGNLGRNIVKLRITVEELPPDNKEGE